MKRLIWIGIGAAAGYVLGARAGHERYETITCYAKGAADTIRRRPSVRDVADSAAATAAAATETARDKAHEAVGRVADNVDDRIDAATDTAREGIDRATEPLRRPA